MTTTLALCNQKGGVGKSTTAFHLARAAVNDGQRVLLVDLDPQGNLTSVTTEDLEEDDAGVADVLSARSGATATDVIVPGIWNGLDVLPVTSGVTMEEVRDELVVSRKGREHRLRAALSDAASGYDLVLIDCAPSLDLLTINGLTAATGVVVVTQSKLWSANGLSRLLDSIASVTHYYNPSLEVAGILINQHEEHTLAGAHWRAELQEAADIRGLRIIDPPIPKRVAIGDAVEESRGLDESAHTETRQLAAIYTAHLTALTTKETRA
ncbi:ParA family protein [Nesterenkonia sp.]|uniref:ParA family protein n=1 Tax=Nesterenkonia sp. TaxID=704201 RepID=UPI00262BDC2D|nr:ParA family protein [Nesterenkonia sp.]